jgi:2-keto-4-pentenoate hydratase
VAFAFNVYREKVAKGLMRPADDGDFRVTKGPSRAAGIRRPGAPVEEKGERMDERAAGRAAETIWAAWQERRLLEALPEDCRPRTLAEGYAAQAALGALAGPTIGWKIAATSAAGQRHIGVDGPLAGRLYERFAHGSGAVLPAAHLHMRVAEAEFCFRLGRDLPPRGRDYGRAEVMDAVAALHLAIEVPDSRFRDFAAAGAPQLLADDSCAAFFVLGPEAASWRGRDLAAHAVAARRNGALAATGSGANVLGDPWIALSWIANDLARRGPGLKAGEVVTTGTCVTPVPIAPGDAVVADFGALGTVEARFAD